MLQSVTNLGMTKFVVRSGAPSRLLLAFLLTAFVARIPAMAQGETTSAIVGAVTDPTGAAIADATVSATNIEDGLKRSVKKDDSGRFAILDRKSVVSGKR